MLDNNKSTNLELDKNNEDVLQRVLVALANDHGGIMIGDMAHASHIVLMYHLYMTN